MSQVNILPDGWPRPKGFSQGIIAEGKLMFVAGQVGWTPQEQFETDDFAGQAAQAFQNIADILSAAGAKPEHVTRLTWFITSKQEYLASLKEIGAAYREVFGSHYPVMAVIEVTALMEDRAKIEVEATAVIPD